MLLTQIKVIADLLVIEMIEIYVHVYSYAICLLQIYFYVYQIHMAIHMVSHT